MQKIVATFATKYFARQARDSGATSSPEKYIEFIHRIRIAVDDQLAASNFPSESLADLKDRAVRKLQKTDRTDAPMRSFRVEQALKKLPSASHLPRPFLPLLHLLVDSTDQDPLIAEETFSSRPPSHVVSPRSSRFYSSDSPENVPPEKEPPRPPARRSTLPPSNEPHSDASAESDAPAPAPSSSHRRRPFRRHRSSSHGSRRRSLERAPSSILSGAMIPASPPGGNTTAVLSATTPASSREVPQATILRDLLYPLQGINGQYIKWHDAERCFLLRRDVTVSGPVRILVARIAALGNYYRRIREIIDPHLLPGEEPPEVQQTWWREDTLLGPRALSTVMMPSTATNAEAAAGGPPPIVTFPPSSAVEDFSSNEHPPHHFSENTVVLSQRHTSHRSAPRLPARKPVDGLAPAAWTQFVRDLLAQYYQALSEVETQLTDMVDPLAPQFLTKTVELSTGSTFRQLLVKMDDIRERLVILAETTEAVSQLKGAPLLELLYTASWRGDELGRSMLKNAILQYVLPVWARQLTQWVRSGRVEDPYKEFFIVCEDRANKNDFEDIWKNHAYIMKSRLLPFINDQLAAKFLEAGQLQILIEASDATSINTAPEDQSAAAKGARRRQLAAAEPPEQKSLCVSVSPQELWEDKAIRDLLDAAERVVFVCVQIFWSPCNKRPAPPAAYDQLVNHEISLPVADLAAATTVAEALAQHVEQIICYRSAILISQLLLKHNLIQILDFSRRVLLLQQADFTDRLAAFVVNKNLSPYLREPISQVTDHQLRQALNDAISSSAVGLVPPEILQRLKFRRYQTSASYTSAFQAVYLHWDALGTAASLLLTERRNTEVIARLQAVAWRLSVSSQALHSQAMSPLQCFRRRYLPIPFCRQLPNPAQILEALDEDGYLATFMCETICSLLGHSLQILRAHMFQDFAPDVWLRLIKSLRNMIDDGAMPLNRLVEAYEDFLASLAIGWFLKEDAEMPMPAAYEILNGDAQDEERRPVLTAILRLCDLAMQFADLSTDLYPRMLDFVTTAENNNSTGCCRVQDLQNLLEVLQQTSSQVFRLLYSLENGSRENDLSDFDPLNSERTSLIMALRTNLNLGDYCNEAGGLERLCSIAAQLVNERAAGTAAGVPLAG